MAAGCAVRSVEVNDAAAFMGGGGMPDVLFSNTVDSAYQVEALSRMNSPAHKLNTGIKIMVTLLFLTLVISFPPKTVSELVPFFIYPMFMMSLSAMPYRPIISRIKFAVSLALPFALAKGLGSLLLIRDSESVIGGFDINGSIVSFVSIMMKILLCVSAVLMLFATTPFYNICAVFTGIRVIRVFGLRLSLIYIFINTLIDEGRSMRTAYCLRAPIKKNMPRNMRVLWGQILLRGFSRASRAVKAMKCRGFSGRYYPTEKRPIRFADILFITAAAIILLILRFFNINMLVGEILVI
ncbi:MAG: energy-coupling factor transporter transmembrane protein EcfT [Treponema sp.]|nr:energy-coupling factor transporter transmembrane protein EcfT [Treponema sp.]